VLYELSVVTLASKQTVWRGALLAAIVVLIASAAEPASPLRLTAIAAWFLILAGLQSRWFRCPSCDRHILSAGTTCRHCGHSF